MSEHIYYEVSFWSARNVGLNATAMPGNMIFNRRHWQNGVEVLAPIKGTLHVKIEDAEYILQEGDLITIDTGLPHEVTSGTVDNMQLIFNVDDSLMRRKQGEQIWLSTVGTNAISPTHPDVLELRQSIAKLAFISTNTLHQSLDISSGSTVNNDDWYNARIELNRILLLLSKHSFSQQTAPIAKKFNPCFIKLIDIVHRDYAKDIRADSVAKELGYGVSSIFRMSRQYTGMSFSEYLNSVRISVACGMLLQSHSSILEIAYACGFSTTSNFYRVFKLLTGITPLEYRENAGGSAKNTILPQYTNIMQYNKYQPFETLPYDWTDIFSGVALK